MSLSRSVDLSVDLMLREFGTTYQSVEVRTAAIKLHRRWYNLMSTLRFSREDSALVAKQTRKRWQALPNVDGPLLRFHRRVFVGDRGRGVLFGMLRRGVLRFGQQRVWLGWTPDVLTFHGHIQPAQWSDPEGAWPCLDAEQTGTTAHSDTEIMNALRSAVYAPDLQRYLNARTYTSAHAAARRFLGLREERQEYLSTLQVWMPVYARTDDIAMRGETVAITYTAVESLGSRVYAHAVLRNDRDDHAIKLAVEKVNGHFVACGEVPGFTGTCALDVSLIDRELGELVRETRTRQSVSHPVAVNPLWTLLQRFCSPSEFAGLLASPAAVPEDQSAGKPQRLFETHVAWLLSCFGWQTIWLGKHERLHESSTKVILGTLDLLAYHRESGAVLLGGCTIGPPNDADYNGLVNMRAHLLAGLPEDDTPPMCLVIFSAAASCPRSRRLHEDDRGLGNDVIHVLDAECLREAVSALEHGDTQWLLRQFADAVRGFSIGQ